MVKFFGYSKDQGVILNKEEILLVKEFAALYTVKYNKEAGDTKGLLRNRAFREFAYIYLTQDWMSPYIEMSEEDREEAALEDIAEMPGYNKWSISPELEAAIEKYKLIQETRSLKLLNSAYKGVDELRGYFESVDLFERDEQAGKPVYSAKDLSSNIASLGKLLDSLEQLEERVKKEQKKKSDLRADAEPGLFD